MIDCPVPAVQSVGTCTTSYCTTPKDETVSTLLHQTWQDLATPTSHEPPGMSENDMMHAQAIPDMGMKSSIHLHSKPIEPNAHLESIAPALRSLFCLTPVKVRLKPMIDPSAHSTPYQNITTLSFDTVIPKTDTQSLKSSPAPIPTPQKAITPTTPYTNPSIMQPQQKAPAQHLLAPPSSKTLKRKITEEEIATFAKRLRKAACGSESVFFDPNTVLLIPQLRLEQFIL